MNDNFTNLEWYKSSAGPGVSQTLINIAGNFLPMLNMILAYKHINVLPGPVNFWISLAVFIYFSIKAAFGYIKAKKILGARIALLESQVTKLGGQVE